MTPRPDVSEERKDQILDAATDVFAHHGFHDARMDDIAAQAGLSKGALYWYFKSKEAIIDALLGRIFDWMLKDLKDVHAAQGPVRERLLEFERRAGEQFMRTFNLLPVTFEFYAVALRSQTVRGFLKAYFATFRQLVGEMIQQGIDRGEFRAVDPEHVAITLGALYEGLTLLWVVDPETVDWDQMSSSSLQLLLDGMRRE